MLHDYHLRLTEHLTFFHKLRFIFLQLAHILLLWQSEARCLGPVQLKPNFFFEMISLRSGVPLNKSHSLDL